MMGVRCRGRSIASPTLTPRARHPGFTPAAFAGECFHDLYLAVDEGAEGGSAGADHADGEFELAVLRLHQQHIRRCGRGSGNLRPDYDVPESVGDIVVACAIVEPVDEDF